MSIVAMKKMVFFSALVVVSLQFSMFGCAKAKPYAPIEKTTNAHEEEYLLQLGDVIEIKFFYNSELNERVTVRPDGRISLQLIDEVKVAGLTASQLATTLKMKYSRTLRNPELSVIVREFAGLKVYVGGEVNVPGVIPLSGHLTALQAIFHAGGFKNTAELQSIIILRNQEMQKPLFITLNLKEDLADHVQQNDMLLKPYDIVFVPKTTIAKLNQFVDQYIEKLIPISKTFGFSYVYNLNPQVEVTK